MIPKDLNKKWKRAAWNGVRMEIPADWEIIAIDHEYIQLSSRAGPVLELKWSSAPPSYSMEKGFSRIQKKRAGRHSWKIHKSPLPPSWLRTDAALPITPKTAVAFSWQTNEENGTGLLCHIPDASQVMLLRLYAAVDPAVQEKYINKLGFHKPSDTILWSLFDIEAETPADYKLTAFHFYPGKFNLTFTRKKSRLNLLRWSPASVLMGPDGLEEFTRKHFKLPQSFDGFKAMEINGWHGLQWMQSQSAGKRLFPFFNLFFPNNNEVGLIWHLTDKNRLLAVHMESQSDLEIINDVSRCFKCR